MEPTRAERKKEREMAEGRERNDETTEGQGGREKRKEGDGTMTLRG